MVPLRLAIFILLFCLQWHHLLAASGIGVDDITLIRSKVSITNNGYDDIVVAISPAVPQTQSQPLILTIPVLYYTSLIFHC
jgi:hypothetical protein